MIQLSSVLIQERLKQDEHQEGYIHDGFPRNTVQAETLDKMLKELGCRLILL